MRCHSYPNFRSGYLHNDNSDLQAIFSLWGYVVLPQRFYGLAARLQPNINTHQLWRMRMNAVDQRI